MTLLRQHDAEGRAHEPKADDDPYQCWPAAPGHERRQPHLAAGFLSPFLLLRRIGLSPDQAAPAQAKATGQKSCWLTPKPLVCTSHSRPLPKAQRDEHPPVHAPPRPCRVAKSLPAGRFKARSSGRGLRWQQQPERTVGNDTEELEITSATKPARITITGQPRCRASPVQTPPSIAPRPPWSRVDARGPAVGSACRVEGSRGGRLWSVTGTGTANDFGRGGSASRRGDELADISPLSLNIGRPHRQQGDPEQTLTLAWQSQRPQPVRAAGGRELFGDVPDGVILAPSAGCAVSSMWTIRRSATDRKLTGLCGGVARYWGIDPTLVRVGAALLALSGGIGLVLYLAGWLLIPEDGKTQAWADELFGPQVRRWSKEVWLAIVVIASVIAFAIFGAMTPFGVGPAIVLAGIWYFGYYRNHKQTGARAAVDPPDGPDYEFISYPGPATPFTEAADAWRQRIEEHAQELSAQRATYQQEDLSPQRQPHGRRLRLPPARRGRARLSWNTSGTRRSLPSQTRWASIHRLPKRRPRRSCGWGTGHPCGEAAPIGVLDCLGPHALRFGGTTSAQACR